MTVKLVGMDNLSRSFDAYMKRKEKLIVDLRKRVARELVEALLDNVPVWSGRTVRSIGVSNNPGGSNAGEPHPDRNDRAKDGRWVNHKAEWGDTKAMPLGAEPNRASAEAIAMASVEAANYALGAGVFITSSSYNWGDVDNATYRPQARNTAVVSDLAIAQVKAKFGKAVQ